MSAEVSACPLDGNLRRVVDRDRLGVLWKCGWCGQHTREEHEPDVRNDLNREWNR